MRYLREITIWLDKFTDNVAEISYLVGISYQNLKGRFYPYVLINLSEEMNGVAIKLAQF